MSSLTQKNDVKVDLTALAEDQRAKAWKYQQEIDELTSLRDDAIQAAIEYEEAEKRITKMREEREKQKRKRRSYVRTPAIRAAARERGKKWAAAHPGPRKEGRRLIDAAARVLKENGGALHSSFIAHRMGRTEHHSIGGLLTKAAKEETPVEGGFIIRIGSQVFAWEKKEEKVA